MMYLGVHDPWHNFTRRLQNITSGGEQIYQVLLSPNKINFQIGRFIPTLFPAPTQMKFCGPMEIQAIPLVTIMMDVSRKIFLCIA